MIGVHPKALINFDEQSADLQDEINDIIAGYENPVEFYITKLTEGISTLSMLHIHLKKLLFVCLTLNQMNMQTLLVVKTSNQKKKTR